MFWGKNKTFCVMVRNDLGSWTDSLKEFERDELSILWKWKREKRFSNFFFRCKSCKSFSSTLNFVTDPRICSRQQTDKQKFLCSYKTLKNKNSFII